MNKTLWNMFTRIADKFSYIPRPSCHDGSCVVAIHHNLGEKKPFPSFPFFFCIRVIKPWMTTHCQLTINQAKFSDINAPVRDCYLYYIWLRNRDSWAIIAITICVVGVLALIIWELHSNHVNDLMDLQFTG